MRDADSRPVHRLAAWNREEDENYLMWCVAELARPGVASPGWLDSRAEQISLLSQYLNGTVPYQWRSR